MARTLSAEAHEKALAAAIKLIEKHGIDGTSMDAIAREAGISKATLYKHWKDKDALFIEAISRVREALPDFRTGHPKRDLVALLNHLAFTRKETRFTRLMPRIIGYAAQNPNFGLALQRRTVSPTDAQVIAILEEAISKGDLDPTLDASVALSWLYGPLVHRRMMHRDIPPSLPEKIVDAYWAFYTRR